MAIPNSNVLETIAINPDIQSKIAIILEKFLENIFHSDSAAAFLMVLAPYFLSRSAASSSDNPEEEDCKFVKTC